MTEMKKLLDNMILCILYLLILFHKVLFWVSFIIITYQQLFKAVNFNRTVFGRVSSGLVPRRYNVLAEIY